MAVVLDPFGPTRGDFDRTILAYFEEPPEGIVLRTDGLQTAARRRLNGGAILVWDEEHWRHKRGHVPKAPDHVDMHKPFDASRFNFNKVDSREVIAKVRLQGSVHTMLTNISPLMVGHVILALHSEEGLPQGALGAEGVRCMAEFATMSQRRDFCVVYNSLGAFASVNHLHLHGMYLSGLDGDPKTDRLPLEDAGQSLFADFGGAQVFTVDTDQTKGLGMRAFAIKGLQTFAAEVAGNCVELLHKLRIPHNLLVHAGQTEEEPMTFFVVPRQPQERFDVAAAGFNAAVCEVCGFLFMQSSEAYLAQSALSVSRSFAGGASLSPAAFGALMDHLADSLRWRRPSRWGRRRSDSEGSPRRRRASIGGGLPVHVPLGAVGGLLAALGAAALLRAAARTG